ncbi:MFS transporter [Microbacterium sp. BK668]|uniref:MFS transporter n=1 Tax=Microbacterium sp. BK668 TaxID=2512118 RepID=UPI0010E32862|nr:MFS transporter [Microbacterium sp. BK668]TDN91776.1 putative MFS family arabinose efflux permease [Microbacterium sp. BK668]
MTRSQGFRRFWAANTISAFGSAATAVALPVLVVDGLQADAVEVGIVNAAQFVPYAVLGLVAGVYVDRWRRRRTLVVASLGRALSLGMIPLLWAVGALSVWNLVALLLLFGGFSVFGFAASQSLLPRLVDRERLLRANAQIDQGEAAALTLGPTLAGLVVRWLGAPIALLIDAVSYVVDAILVAGVRVTEVSGGGRRSVVRDIREGLRATYRHPVLLPLSLSTHVWFVANAASLTILSLLVLRTLDLGAALFGLLLSVAGAATLAGAALAERSGRRFGSGATITGTRVLYPLAWVGVGLVPVAGGPAGTALLFAALAISGLAAGIENANEMSYRQRAVPDELLGRVNATGRSVNRTAGALGAVLGGVLASVVGVAPSIWIVAAVFAVAAGIAVFSPLRVARS